MNYSYLRLKEKKIYWESWEKKSQWYSVSMFLETIIDISKLVKSEREQVQTKRKRKWKRESVQSDR